MLTIDVEDWFHILESDDAPGRDRWDSLESRVERNTDRLLELIAETGSTATFFTVGWVAWQCPELIKRIAAAGHEIASHSFWHEVMRRHDRDSLRADLKASRQLLEDLTGTAVDGFRAPGGSITQREAWVFDVILEAGFSYDSSLCPGMSSHGGFASDFLSPHLVECASGQLVEVPSSTIGAGRFRTPYAGGGYLRFFPQWLLRRAIDLDNGLGRPANLYVHPRELDVDQPRMELPRKRSFKYYVGLDTTERKLRALAERYRFIGVRQWIREHRPELIGRVLDVRELALDTGPDPDPALVPPAPPQTVGA
jgi:polysaccharide deacetylase family protein (PEP-CTERM system associated)